MKQGNVLSKQFTQLPVTKLDIKVGFRCNNHCLFCVQGEKRNKFEDKPFEQIKSELEVAKSEGIDAVCFTGGEVSIRKDFFQIIELAHQIGFSIIQVQSNGRMFANDEFAEKSIQCGANEFNFALHGHVAPLHDYLTCAKSFAQTVKGIRNIKRLGGWVGTNSVINRSNYRTLPELAKLLIYLDVDQYQLAFVHALGTAGQNFVSIVPRKTLVVPYVKRALQLGIQARKIVMTEAIPYCFMKGYEQYVAEKIIPPTKVVDANFTLENYTDYRWNEGKIKGSVCNECDYNEICEGPWREYPEFYGWDEFKPLKVKKRLNQFPSHTSKGQEISVT